MILESSAQATWNETNRVSTNIIGNAAACGELALDSAVNNELAFWRRELSERPVWGSEGFNERGIQELNPEEFAEIARSVDAIAQERWDDPARPKRC